MNEKGDKEEDVSASLGATGPKDSNPVSSMDFFGESVVLSDGEDAADSSVFAETIRCGTEISRYRVLQKIGEGGMGEVYLAQHIKFKKRLYAIKFLKRELVTAEAKSRFESEINAMEDLQHQNVVFAHDAGEFRGASYLVMDYVDGLTVKDIAKGGCNVHVSQAAEIIRQAAVGLQHAHEQNMVHRDIKPSNLMLTKDSVVKILDMGLARFTDSRTIQLTAAHQILGTPDYMAPEQWQNTTSVDIRADIYSLGCSLYCLLAGHAPFEDNEHSSLATKLSAHLKEAPPKIEFDRDDQRFQNLNAVLDRMLEKDPTRRFQTPKDVVDALVEFCDGANLSELTKDVSPVEYMDFETRSFQDVMEDTRPKPSKNQNGQSTATEVTSTNANKPLALGTLAIIATLLIVVVVSLLSGNKNSSTEDSDTVDRVTQSEVNQSSSNPISISYIAKSNPDIGINSPGQELIEMGDIGDHAFSGRFGDLVKVSVALPSPKYFYLIALNPTDDPKHRVQLCYPESDSVKPERKKDLVYPSGENLFFPMTDGVGQQAFVILTSDVPLPSFAEWKEKNLGMTFPWRASAQTGVWKSKNQHEIARVLVENNQRLFRGDVVEVKSDILQRTVGYLKEKHVGVSVIAYPVLQK